jgi:hypothetical protein
MSQSVMIPRRYRGPADSGNGGYSCGALAELVGGVVEVTLRSPPPLDVALEVAPSDGGLALRHGDKVVAEAKAIALDVEAPAAPSFDEAERAAARFMWRENHAFPSCFVCGPERGPGDGLEIFPGPVEGRAIAAAPFVPDATVTGDDGRVKTAIVWAALDCPSWFGFHCFEPFDGRILLGRLAARVDERPRAGARCVVAGWSLGRDGRKIHCGSALWGEDGALLAVARATWIVLK